MNKLTKIAGLLAICLIFLLSACSKGDIQGQTPNGLTMTDRHAYNEECIKGVVYYENTKRLAPAFKPDGTLYTCGR